MTEQEMAQKNLILKMEVGSNLYGTATPASDRDYLGVFVPSEEYILGNKRCEQVELRTNPSSSGKRNTKDDVDTVVYSLPKYLHLLAQNNPNILETLFVPKKNLPVHTMLGDRILNLAPVFVSKKVKHTFLGYAFAQKKSLTHKRERFQAIGDALSYLDTLDTRGTEVLPEPLNLTSTLREDGTWGMYEKGQPVYLVRSLLEQELLAYGYRVDSIKKYGFDTKFASHLIRLLDEGLQLLAEGTLTFPLPNNNLVRDIKLGKYTLDQVLQIAEDKEKLVEQAYLMSTLPSTPDLEVVNKIQVELIKEAWGWTSSTVARV